MFSFFGITGMHKEWQPTHKPAVRPETQRINGVDNTAGAQEPKT